MAFFGLKTYFKKKFPRLFLSPNQSYVKKLGQNGLQTGFYRGGQNLPPPATRDAFQMLPLVGLKSPIYLDLASNVYESAYTVSFCHVLRRKKIKVHIGNVIFLCVSSDLPAARLLSKVQSKYKM